MTSFQKEIEALDIAACEINQQRHELHYLHQIEQKKAKVEADLRILRSRAFVLKENASNENLTRKEQLQLVMEVDAIDERCRILELEKTKLEEELQKYRYNPTGKRFNKYICFKNIRELLQTRDVKIGQIEKEAGCQPGYMSRLEKENNTTEPSMEFLVTASQMLKVSLDVLLTIDLTELKSTEKYLISFIDKLIKDTIDDKLEWEKESDEQLNTLDVDGNGCTGHPLFELESFFEENINGYPEEITRVVFFSDTFKYNTFILDDCFNLKMKNKAMLYLMNVRKNTYTIGDSGIEAKEVWIYTPGLGKQFLMSNHDSAQISYLVETLFDTVKKYMKHPNVKKEIRSIIDAFMDDDLGHDDIDLPF